MFFFKVITEQVVVDANLPSVSKVSVGQVGLGRVEAATLCRRQGPPAGSSGDVSISSVLRAEEWEGGTGVKLQKLNRKRRVSGAEGKGHPWKKLLSPLEGGGPGTLGRESEEETRSARRKRHFSWSHVPSRHRGLAGVRRGPQRLRSWSPTLSSLGVRAPDGAGSHLSPIPCVVPEGGLGCGREGSRSGCARAGTRVGGSTPLARQAPLPQICVSCTFSLEPLLKSRGSWMELRPGGPLPPQPPPLGLLL